MKKFFALFIALEVSASLFAYKVPIGDLYYNLNPNNQTAEVTHKFELSEYNYYDLTTVNIPATVTYNNTTYSVTSIGSDAFLSCISLTSVTIPNSVTIIGKGAFSYCNSLPSITIPNSVTIIGQEAFFNCSSLTSVVIGSSVATIGNYAFYNCSSLTSFTIPSNVTIIGECAFSDCSGLTSIAISNGVTSIGEGAFSSCSRLTSVTIPNSVINIGNYAFHGCSSLATATIGSGVISIGNFAFRICNRLISFTNYATIPQAIEADVFYNINLSACTLYVSEGSIDLYEAADVWKDFGHIETIDSISTTVSNTSVSADAAKRIVNGQVLILRDGKTYTPQGMEIR